MKTSNITKIFKTAQRFMTKHSPEILTGVGVVGMCTTVVLAVKATPKAMKLIEEEKYKKDGDNPTENNTSKDLQPLTPIETVKVAWKSYVPAVLIGSASIACIIGASSVNARRNAALYSAYKLSETALAEFKEKAVEVVGDEKVKEIKDKVNKDKIDKNPVSEREVIVLGRGKDLCYESFGGRYFESDLTTIEKIANHLSAKMINGEMYVSLNEFYSELGLPHTKLGYEIGWRVDKGIIEISPSYQAAEDGRPCMVIDFVTPPEYDFDSLY